MIESLADAMSIDGPTFLLALALAAFGCVQLKRALDGSLAVAAAFPLLLAAVLLAHTVAVGMNLVQPISSLAFRESDAAESLVSLALSLLVSATAAMGGCLLMLRLATLRRPRAG